MRTVTVFVAGLVLGLFGILLGLGVVAGAFFAAYQGWVAAPSLDGDHCGVYAETFALYLALFIGLSFLASFRAWGDWRFGLAGVLMVFSLVALFWPRLRGVKWSQVREDLGLTFSWLDLPGGVATYFGALPLVVVGAVIAAVMALTLKRLGVTVAPPSHPVAEAVRGVPWWVWAQIVVAACVCAPVVEEVFFRGVLYAHLSRLGKAWPRAGRVALAVGASSFLFAVIHPQGWLGVPILSALATAFALAREWRGGLVPGMVAHAINNGVAVLLLRTLA
jgi:membrane protease YdiL (CAAX protease family)